MTGLYRNNSSISYDLYNDGIPDLEDVDEDNDGIPDYLDTDDDNDGIPDDLDGIDENGMRI